MALTQKQGRVILATRRIFVDPGDRVEVYVMHNPDLPKNKREWECVPHPHMFSFRPMTHCVVFEDPGVDVRRTLGGQAESSDTYPIRA